MTAPQDDITRGVAELQAALDALQTSLENLDAQLYPATGAWSAEARAAHDRALAEWADTARHMQATIHALQTRGRAASAASA